MSNTNTIPNPNSILIIYNKLIFNSYSFTDWHNDGATFPGAGILLVMIINSFFFFF